MLFHREPVAETGVIDRFQCELGAPPFPRVVKGSKARHFKKSTVRILVTINAFKGL